MSRVEELIEELCPDGVEYREIQEIFNLKNGYTPSKRNLEFWKEGTIPWFRMEDIRINGRILEDSVQHVSKEAVKGGKLIPKNSIIMSTTATIGEHALIKIDALTNQQITSFSIKDSYSNKLDIKFAFHYFYLFGEWCKANANQSGSIRIISLDKLKKFSMAIPPIEVQKEIVRILDTFTELAEELTLKLTAELTARKKQYEYYKDEIFKVNSNTLVVKLGDIADISRGGNFKKTDFTDVGIPCIHYGQIYTRYGLYACKAITNITEEAAKKAKYATKNDLIMAVTSENIQDVCKAVAWLGEEEIAIGGHTAIIHHKQNAKYLSYYFSTSMFSKQKAKLAQGTKVLDVAPNKLLNVEIPLPSLEQQEIIVNILDRLDEIFTDISEGVLAEIEARKKQYKYYRDKLLTFKKIEE